MYTLSVFVRESLSSLNRPQKGCRKLSRLAPVFQKVDNGIHCISHYPLDSAIGLPTLIRWIWWFIRLIALLWYHVVRIFYSIQSPYCLTCICISVCPSIFSSVVSHIMCINSLFQEKESLQFPPVFFFFFLVSSYFLFVCLFLFSCSLSLNSADPTILQPGTG